MGTKILGIVGSYRRNGTIVTDATRLNKLPMHTDTSRQDNK